MDLKPSEFISDDEVVAVAVAEEQLRETIKAATPSVIDPDTCSDSDLRALVKQQSVLLAHLLAKQNPVVDALGEDQYSGHPVYFDKPECPRCKPFSEFKLNPETGRSHPVCHDCCEPITGMEEFQNRGLESPTVDHMHLHTVEGAKGRQIRIAVRRELCLPCFRIDWAKAYPNKPCDL